MNPLHFNSISDFYPYYLMQHRNLKCRTLHFTGTSLVIAIFLLLTVTQYWLLLPVIPVVGYGFAWTGHFLFEKNKPAAFKNPLWSLGCDFIMFWHILTGQIGEKMREAEKLYSEIG